MPDRESSITVSSNRPAPEAGEAGPAWLAALASSRGFRVRLPDGSTYGSASPSFTVSIRSTGVLRALAVAPTPLRLGRAWVEGDLDLDGDLFAAMAAVHEMEADLPGPAMRVLGVLRALLRPFRSAGRDIASHYDLPTAFYELFLDPRMVYTCAYYRGEDAGLEQAQADKLDLVCRKLRLQPGHHLLDLGCGWGGLARWAAANYGATVHAVTLSKAQAEWAAGAVARDGLEDRVRIEHLDYRRLPTSRRYDRIAALGMIEHLGRRAYPSYFGLVRDLLTDDGLFLNHGITMRAGASWSSEMEFLDRYVFPGLDLVDIGTTVQAMEGGGLEVLDVESLRPHYARTTRDWAERLWAAREEAVRIAGDRAWRIFVAYLAAASVAFEQGWIGLAQVVARKGGQRDGGSDPALREEIYSSPAGAACEVR